jgi:hypothetical protein
MNHFVVDDKCLIIENNKKELLAFRLFKLDDKKYLDLRGINLDTYEMVYASLDYIDYIK